ncbi:MAG: metallophosphoesterase [Gammaproteobacteria bacterium]|nr:metallophosphoesterase [Gammaproteobacteria bacterium]
MTADAAPLRLLQLTDSHIYSDPAGELLGIRTLATFEQVLAHARHSPVWPPHAVILSGDLVNDETCEAYSLLRVRLEGLCCPVYCLPGNHDDPRLMRHVLPGRNVFIAGEVRLGSWLLILLDSRVPGSPAGLLAAGELERLDTALAAHTAGHAFIFVHHHPLPVGSAWMDAMGLRNAGALFAVLQRYPQVRGIAAGHVHQASAHSRGGLAVFTTPSTCVQFLPGADRFLRDDRSPGYRWFELRRDGGVDTGVVWTAGTG